MSVSEMAGDGWKKMIHPADLARHTEKCHHSLTTGTPFENEVRVRRASDGQYRWFLHRGVAMRDEAGNILKWFGTGADIEDLKRAEVKLRQDEQELRRITDAIPLSIVVLNPDGGAIYANRVALDYTGLTLDDVIDNKFRERIFHPEDVERLRKSRRDSLATDVPFENEQRALGKDGKYRWFLIRYNPLLDENGKVARWYATGTDIEDRKRAQEALRSALDLIQKSEAKLRQVIDTIPTMAWCNLPDGPNEFLNKQWHEYTGLSAEESYGWGWQAAFHPEDIRPLMEKWQEQLGSGESGEIEARVRRYDGVYRWFLIRMAPFRDETGKIVRWYGTSTDIENLKQTEEKLREDERELRRITDAIPHIILTLDPCGVPLYANQTMLEYTGLTSEEVVTPGFRERISHPEDIERFKEQRKAALARGLPFEVEQRARRRDGEYRLFLIRYNPFRDELGHVVRWYLTGTDIHDRVKAEERTRNENLALREQIDRDSMFEDIVGSSEALGKVLRQVAKVAPSDSTVLILGETGTGKELIARAIHKRSKRLERAFIGVNCGAIPATLIASELFGHEKGAFTGATQRRLGRF